MRIVVAGGTGLIGTRVARLLGDRGHQVVTASRATGVNTFTAEGLEEALVGAEVVVDVSNSSYTDERGALEFFEVSTLNLLSYGAAAGVRHHVALSVVGTDRLAASERGYFAAKAQQERLIVTSSHAYSLVHATQFFEFLVSIADAGGVGGRDVRLADALVRPMAADDVAEAVAGVAVRPPLGGMVEFGGPDEYRLQDVVQRALWDRDDARQVTADPLARYFGALLDERELLPGDDATIAPTRFDDWLRAAGQVRRTGS